MSDWDAALEAQTYMLNWLHGETGPRLVGNFITSLVADGEKGDDTITPTAARIDAIHVQHPNQRRRLSAASTEGVVNGEVNKMANATPFYVSDEMCELLDAAWPAMPSQPLRITDLPTAIGFIYFDRPMLMPDVMGRPMSIRLITWQPASNRYPNQWYEDDPMPPPNLSVSYWTDWDSRTLRRDDWFVREDPTFGDLSVVRQFGRFGLAHYELWPFGDGLTEALDYEQQEEVKARWDLELTELEYPGRRILAAFFALVAQPIVVRAPQHAPKRLARSFGWASSSTVIPTTLVITLRRKRTRAEGIEGEHNPVEWSHRWLVAGHWRNQYLPSVDEHRLTWIAAYQKGPEDKPLVVKKKAYRWVR